MSRQRNVTRNEAIGVYVGTAVWIAGLLAAIITAVALGDTPQWLLGGLVLVSVAGLAAVIGVIGRTVVRDEGVERKLYVESSALAFWATMLAAFTYALLESLTELQPPHAYYVVGFGAIAWAISHGLQSEKTL